MQHRYRDGWATRQAGGVTCSGPAEPALNKGRLCMQALADGEHGVIAEAVGFLSAVCQQGQMRRPLVLAAVRKARSFGSCLSAFVGSKFSHGCCCCEVRQMVTRSACLGRCCMCRLTLPSSPGPGSSVSSALHRSAANPGLNSIQFMQLSGHLLHSSYRPDSLT